MYDHTSHRGFKHFCYYRLQVFSTKEILKSYTKNCFNINGKQRIIIPKKGEYVKFKHYERKIKKPFKIYADFKSILVPEDNGKKNPEEFHRSKYHRHIACSHRHKSVCVDDKSSEPFKTSLGKKAIYNFINSMIEENKYCSGVMKKKYFFFTKGF